MDYTSTIPNQIMYPIKKDKLRFSYLYDLIIIVIILNISQSSILNSRYIPFALGILLVIINFILRKKYNRSFLLILTGWLLINISAGIFLTSSVPYARIVINTFGLIILPYLMINIMGKRFWERFEKFVFFLTFISIPLYALNFIFREYFDNLWSFFNPITSESFGKTFPYWTSFIYVNAIGDPNNILLRNSGFMWEPGAFAMVIIGVVIYNLRKNENKISRRIIIYFIALITTFSTAGYLAIVFIIASVYLKKVTPGNVFFLSLLMVFYFLFVYRLGFMSEKINNYISGYKENQLNFDEESGYIKVNRLRGAYYAFKDALKVPTGYGVISKEDIAPNEVLIYGTNGIGSLLVMWGFLGLFYLMKLLFRFIKFIVPNKINTFNSLLFFLALLIMFFSNPISRNLFFYLIIFTPVAYNKLYPENFTRNGNQADPVRAYYRE